MAKQYGTKTFKGGIHPDLDPALLGNKEYVKIALPEKVRIPLQQHIGAPAQSIVKVGDSVIEGQKIAEATGFVSANIHATISGKVTAIKKFPVSIFKQAICIEISSDTTAQTDWKIETSDWRKLSEDELKDRIIEAGIVGMGGATFPTHVKLSPPDTKKIDLIVANGVECEPYLDTDRNTMCTFPNKVYEGLQILMKILNCKQGIIGIESDTPDAIEVMKQTVAGNDSISVLPLEVKYPQGAEKQLIYAASKREVPSGGLPMDVGVLVCNVATMTAVYDAVTAKKPLISRSLTLVGHCLKKSVNVTVPIGMLLSDVIKQLGGFVKQPTKIISGGPMMGEVQYTIDVPITKGTSGIIFQAENESAKYSMGPCIRCGRCVDICPMGISPAQICQAIEFGDFELAKKWGLLDCIKCGSCSYTCPANREMVQLIKFGEQQLKKKGS